MRRREWRDLVLILGIALALRLALWWILPREGLVSDEPEYLAAAAWLAGGRGFSFYAEWPWLRPPLYLLFLAPIVRLLGLHLAPIRVAQLALSLTVPALLYGIGRTAFGRRVALTAGLLSALWLPLAVLPHLVLAENLFLPLLLAACWCLMRFQQDRRQGWVLAGGLLLGLTTLTRGLTIAFLPLAGLWTLAIGGLRQGWRALLPPLLLVATALVVILPWTGYNYLRYGQLILVDTTGGYNFWLGTQGGQFHNLREVHKTLTDLPDPAARQDYAYRQGWQAIAADPAGFLTDRGVELGQLLRINYGADERLADGFALGAVPVPHLLALFLLEDTPYVLLVPLALLGLFTCRSEPGRGLVLAWLVYNVLAAVVFFAIGRFRMPLLPFLALYAAAAVVQQPWRAVIRGNRRGQEWSRKGRLGMLLRLAAVGLLTAGFWAIVLPSYLGPYPASLGVTALGVQARGAAAHLARAEAALFAGDPEAARAALEPALSYRPDGARPLASAQVVLAEIQRASGDEQGALDTLDGMSWFEALLLRGDILRARGALEEARRAFGARNLVERNPTDWAWKYLHPPAGRVVDLGGGLDWGLVDGFYQEEREGETTYRWSGEMARLRFPDAGTGRPAELRLRLRGWRPAGESPPEVVLLVEGSEVAHWTATADWEEVTAPLPAVPWGGEVIVSLRATTFLAGPQDLLATGHLRLLGVMVDWAELGE